jgi:regulator of protease activity HflC (stomatin/prohibitin superfamily)
MIWFGIVAIILAVGALVVRPRLAEESGELEESPARRRAREVAQEDVKDVRFGLTIASIVLFCAGILFAAMASIAIVPPGHVGVQVLFGSVRQATLSEGLSVVNPFVSVSHMSGRTQTYTMAEADSEKGRAIVALSSDGLRIPMDVSIIYRLDPTHASWILQNVGYEYQDILMKPAARTAVRQAAAGFTAQEAYSTKRDALADSMMDTLNKSIMKIFEQRGFKHKAIHIEQVLLRNVDLPKRVKDAIEQKLEAEQEAQKMTFVLEKETREAERKKVEAGGIQQFQEIVKKGIDNRLLRWKGIEATENLAKSNNTKIIVIGGGGDGLPIILNTSGTNANIKADKPE